MKLRIACLRIGTVYLTFPSALMITVVALGLACEHPSGGTGRPAGMGAATWYAPSNHVHMHEGRANHRWRLLAAAAAAAAAVAAAVAAQ